jgi:hypothetical protein
VVFGVVIIGGMLVSGDRIIKAWSGRSASGEDRRPDQKIDDQAGQVEKGDRRRPTTSTIEHRRNEGQWPIWRRK